MIGKILKTESGDVHYWISDQMKSGRETLFFLHGLTACHDLFADQIAYFDGRYNIVTWDAPAHVQRRRIRICIICSLSTVKKSYVI